MIKRIRTVLLRPMWHLFLCSINISTNIDIFTHIQTDKDSYIQHTHTLTYTDTTTHTNSHTQPPHTATDTDSHTHTHIHRHTHTNTHIHCITTYF